MISTAARKGGNRLSIVAMIWSCPVSDEIVAFVGARDAHPWRETTKIRDKPEEPEETPEMPDRIRLDGRVAVVTGAAGVATTYEEVLRSIDGRSPNVEIVQAAFQSARAWGRDGSEQLEAVREALWRSRRSGSVRGERDRQGWARWAFVGMGFAVSSGESESARKNNRAAKAHTVRNHRNQPVVLGPHVGASRMASGSTSRSMKLGGSYTSAGLEITCPARTRRRPRKSDGRLRGLRGRVRRRRRRRC